MDTEIHYFHVHNGKGDHADGDDYEVVIVCSDHRPAIESDPEAEFIVTIEDDGECDMCNPDLVLTAKERP